MIVDRRNAGDEQIRWYLDGHEFFSISESRVGQAVWTAAVNHGFSILLNVAVGGSYPDNQCGCTTPGSQTSSRGTMVVRTCACTRTSRLRRRQLFRVFPAFGLAFDPVALLWPLTQM